MQNLNLYLKNKGDPHRSLELILKLHFHFQNKNNTIRTSLSLKVAFFSFQVSTQAHIAENWSPSSNKIEVFEIGLELLRVEACVGIGRRICVNPPHVWSGAIIALVYTTRSWWTPLNDSDWHERATLLGPTAVAIRVLQRQNVTVAFASAAPRHKGELFYSMDSIV